MRLLMIILPLMFAARLSATEITFEGEAPHNEVTLIRMAKQPGVTVDSLAGELRDAGYLDAFIRRADNRLVVTAGSRAILGSVHFSSDSLPAIAVNAPLTSTLVDRLTDRALRDRYSRGYYWASATIDSITRYGNDLDIYFRVIDGPSVRVEDVALRGLKRTRPESIRRLLPVSPGDSVTPYLLENVSRAARGIDYVRFHGSPEILPRPGFTTADLELSFEELRPVTIEIGGGYIPEAEAELVWHLDLRFNNPFGGGRRAEILSERREEQRQILKIAYRQPVFLAGHGSAGATVATRDYRDAFYEFGVTGRYHAHLQDDLTAGVELGYRRVEPDGPRASYSAYSAAFSAGWARLDDRVNPAVGFSFESSLTYAYRRYDEDTTRLDAVDVFNETRAEAHIEAFRPVIGSLVGHVAGQYIGLETGEELPPPAELILVGGPGTIRGYRNDQFPVIRTALLTVEPRWRFTSGFLFAFYDGAYLNNRAGTPEGEVVTEEDFRSGYGLGLGLNDSRRSVRLSVGWNPELRFDEARLSIELTSDI